MPIFTNAIIDRTRDGLTGKGNDEFRQKVLELLTPDVAEWKDDFMGRTLSTGYQTAQGSGASTLAQLAPTSERRYGLATLITGATDNESAAFSLGLHWRPDNLVVMIAGLTMSSIADVKVEVGWSDITATTDSADANSGAVVAVLATPTATRTDGACWIFDTDDTGNVGWQGFGVANTTVATKHEPAVIGNVDGDNDPNAAAYEFMGVALADGNAKFFRFDSTDADGNAYAKKLTKTYESEWLEGFITSTAPITPYVFAQARTTSSKTITLDYFAAWGYRYNADI